MLELTGLELSRKVLMETKVPMNPEENWSYAVSKGYVNSCSIRGKTPAHTLGAQIYTNISKKSDSPFFKYSTKLQKFGLVELRDTYALCTDVNCDAIEKASFKERDLHPLLVAFLKSDEHFHAYAKTIFHEKSTKSSKNAEKWLHPDMVAVHYSFEDLEKSVVDLATQVGESVIRLFSFELKRSITLDNVREYYFQAVSNSSWANEGYIVAPQISDDAVQQLVKLSASFGIGVIKLNPADVYQSEIIIPSKEVETLDLGLMDDLVRINPDFSEFIMNIQKALKTYEPVVSHYDNILDSDELESYIKKKHIE